LRDAIPVIIIPQFFGFVIIAYEPAFNNNGRHDRVPKRVEGAINFNTPVTRACFVYESVLDVLGQPYGHGVSCVITPRFRTVSRLAFGGIQMNRDKGGGVRLIRGVASVFKAHVAVCDPRHEHTKPTVLQQRPDAKANVERGVRFPSFPIARTGMVFPTVPWIDTN
jgi:hypothetical protein